MAVSNGPYKFLKSNQYYVRQYIRDLYDKMFPTAKEYIKFLREKINTVDRRNLNGSFVQISEDNRGFSFNEAVGSIYDLDNNNFLYQDFWEGLTKKEIDFYLQITEKWLKSKTKKQRRIWNYFVLGISKNNIGPRLNEDTTYVINTIEILQEEFLQLIFER
tara:strand:- start:124 stop:606 length:483 start_codon:yes stop_codon:yes gene_type:complete